jgi:F-type H+-transporting ATPase subunit b
VLIDWFTVAAQALNFLVLVWLLKRFLYQPVLEAVDARERRIAAELADAEAKSAQAREEREEYQRRNEQFAVQRNALLQRAAEEAQQTRQQLLDEARRAADELAARRQHALEEETRNLALDLRLRMRQEVFAVARRTLDELAGPTLEQRLCDVFGARLLALEGVERERLARALAAAGEPALVRSAFALSAEQQAALRSQLERVFGTQPRLRFEVRPELIAGIELSAGGQKLAWSIDDRLDMLEQRVAQTLAGGGTAAAATKAPTRREETA